jgi:uncharacterized membrane protein YbaN (DUF454 family)
VNNAEAKKVLLACRPGTDDLRSAEAETALELARRDPELRQWWYQHQQFQKEAKGAFSEIPVPEHLRERILLRAKVVKLPLWRSPVVLSAAAAIAIILAIVAVWQRPSAENSFQTFRSRMVNAVLRQYRMEVETTNMVQIRAFFSTNGAPADYVLPQNLNQLPAQGAGMLSWQDRRVSMVCLDSGVSGTAFLFVVDKSSTGHPPGQREFARVSELNTVSWTDGDKTYVFAGSAVKSWFDGMP